VLLYCGRGNALFDVADPAPDMVRAQRLVQPSVADEPAFAESLLAFAPGARADTLDARVLLILSGAFVGFLPPHYARAWVDRGELRELLPRLFRSENTFFMVTRGGAAPGAAAAALRATILEAFESSTG
jgi:DNA-binding transcriptional LysR family regulator